MRRRSHLEGPRTPRLLVSIALGASIVIAASRAGASGYVFATFHDDSAAGEKLSTYSSPDGLNFTLVSNTGFAGPSGYLRDPSIMKHIDGAYYVAYTDPLTATCCGKEDHFSIASSPDLVHWTNLTTVAAGVPGVAHTWAPEWFVEGSTVNVIVNIDTLNNDTDFKPYVFTARDATLSTWSAPVPLGFGPNYIDTFVMKVRGVYHAFAKNETTRYLEHATAAKLTGPWTFVGTGNWSGFGPGMEGPCVVSLDDGTWRIFMDSQLRPITARFVTATSADLITWSTPLVLPGEGSLRHGTVIRDTPASATQGDGGTGADSGDGGGAASGDGDASKAAASGDARSTTGSPADSATDSMSPDLDAGVLLLGTDADVSGSSSAFSSGSTGANPPTATLDHGSGAEGGRTGASSSGASATAAGNGGGCSCRAANAQDGAAASPSALLALVAVGGAAGRRRTGWRKKSRGSKTMPRAAC